ncbi:MAG: GNAT family N-acetyltransferase [Cyclobacteriaceae bacterium]
MNLVGRNVELRALVLADAEALTHHADNPKVFANLRDFFPHPYLPENAIEFIDFIATEDPQMTFGIALDGAAIGTVGLVPGQDVYQHTIEMGYWLGEEHWGKGYITEAIGLMTSYAFDTLNKRKIFCCVYAENTGSIRALEKNGFEVEAMLRDQVFKLGRFQDEQRMAKLNPDFVLPTGI